MIVLYLSLSIRRFCNEGHEVIPAKDMREALQQRPDKGTTSSVNSVSTENKTLKMTKLEGFSSFHNFQHEDKAIRIWKAFSVGSGRFIPYSNIFLQHQGPINLKDEEDQDFFPEVSGRNFKTKQDKTSDTEVQIYECSEPGCCQEFDSMEDLDVQMELGVHELVHPNESIYDQLRRQWAAPFGNVTVHKSNTQPISADNTVHSEGESGCPSALPMGWALHALSSKSRFPDCVKLYLKAKFDLGERTG